MDDNIGRRKRGSEGQNGTDQRTFSHRKWLKVDFIIAFPTMSIDSSNEKAMKMVVKFAESHGESRSH
jgi:hypothetical protein